MCRCTALGHHLSEEGAPWADRWVEYGTAPGVRDWPRFYPRSVTIRYTLGTHFLAECAAPVPIEIRPPAQLHSNYKGKLTKASLINACCDPR
jgi:hypothetical protein